MGEGHPPLRGDPPQLRHMPTAEAACSCQGNPPLLRYTPTADAACRCQGNPLQRRDSTAGMENAAHGGERSRTARACSNRASLTTAGRSLGSQIVIRLPPSWAGHLNRHPKTKPQPSKTEHLRKKGVFNELCCSRIKHSSLTALNEQQSSQLSN